MRDRETKRSKDKIEDIREHIIGIQTGEYEEILREASNDPDIVPTILVLMGNQISNRILGERWMVYFTSDLHLGHKVIAPKYRDFVSQEAHDEVIFNLMSKLKKRYFVCLRWLYLWFR